MKKLFLDDDDKLDFCGLGIYSFANTVKLVWSINQQENFNFERADNINEEKGSTSLNTYFVFYDEDYGCTYYLIKNKGVDGYIFQSKIEIPFFLLITGDEQVLAMEHCKTILKDNKNIAAIHPLEPKILNKLAVYL